MKTIYKEFKVNGARVAFYPMKEVKAVVLRIMMHAGAWYEPGNKWGAHHLLEHLTFDGTEKLRSRFEIEQYKEEHGIQHNAWTGGSYIEYWFKFPSDKLDSGLSLFEQMLFYPTLPQRDFAREISVICQEYVDHWSSPENKYWKAVQQGLYGKSHKFSKDAIGQPKYLKVLKRKEILKIHHKFFVPANMYIGIAGNISSLKFRKKMTDLLIDKPTGENAYISVPRRSLQKKYIWHKEDRDQYSINYIWYIPGRENLSLRQRLALGVARYIVGGSARSRLYQALRLEKGLVYQTGASLTYYPRNGEFEVWSSSNKEHVEEVSEEMLKIVKEFISFPIPREEFKRAVEYLNMQTLLSYDSVDGISDIFAGSLFYEKRIIPSEEYIKVANSLSREEARSLMAKYLVKPPYLSVMSREDPKLG